MKKAVFVMLVVLVSAASAQMTWTCVTDSAGWRARSAHTSVVFDNKMWVIGGAVAWPGEGVNDVWWSVDGDSWVCATESAPWCPRGCHTSVVFDGRMWVMGGWIWDGSHYEGLNDVWSSTDGSTWVCVTDSAQWPGRMNHQSVVFDGRMWIVAGARSYYPVNYPREVWSSTDGSTWVCVTNSAPWQGREGPALEVYHDTMWMMGGLSTSTYLHDVWWSVDGENWTRKTVTPGWSGRFVHQSEVFQDRLWICGGLDAGSALNDVWYTRDGATWTCADSGAEWRPRSSHTFFVFDSRLWVAGGDSTWSFLTTKDVWWCSTGAAIEEAPKAELRRPIIGPTVVRGVLCLPASSVMRGASCALLDISGRKVLDLMPGANDVRALAPGVYFVRERSAVSRQHSGRNASGIRKVVLAR